ncbi:MAG: hypothetical protein LDL41_06210 [Coleofasciculus sp. S288]|nr:hypothetical protein [Coleofasciculus sp. S288]
MPFPRWRVDVRHTFLVNASLSALLALMIVIITSFYISKEHNFHWWIDWYYPTIHLAKTFRESPTEAMEILQASLARERNRLYTLPLIPFIWVFGDSRLVYEISLALVYLLPFALVMGAIATQLILTHRQLVFWSTALLTLLIPVSWIPTFMGIPDTGGALFIALATWIYLQDVRARQGHTPMCWWRIPLIGVSIGFAVLLRRHFVYGGIALLGAIAVHTLMVFAIEVRKRFFLAWRNLLVGGVRIGLIGAIALATLFTVAWDFTYKALTTDYKALYVSWSLPFSDIFNLYTSFYGWGTWLLVMTGFSAAILTRAVTLSGVSVMGWSGIFSLIVWLVVLRYGNIFYSLHVTPLVVIGLIAFFWTTWTRLRGNVRSLMLYGASGYLIVNLVLGLTPIGQFDNAIRPVFALSNPPLVRTDYDEVVRLIDYLRQLTPNKEPIYVVGNQRLQLDTTLLRSAELLLYGQKQRRLNILQGALVDSRDTYPIEALLQAKYVVVPNPLPDYPGSIALQHSPTEFPAVGEWMLNKDLDVVRVVFDAFTQNWEFAQDFKRLPVQFTLARGAVVSIYERIRPTPVETAVRTLYAMQQQINEQPGGQLDWIEMSQPLHNSFVSIVRRNFNNTYRLVTRYSGYHKRSLDNTVRPEQQNALAFRWKSDRPLSNPVKPSDEGERNLDEAFDSPKPQTPFPLLKSLEFSRRIGTSFLYLGSLPEAVKVAGAITYLDKPCVSSSVRLTMFDKQGQILSSTETSYPHKQGITRFQLSISGQNPAYLLLDVLGYDNSDRINYCTLAINALTVSPTK